MIITGLVIVYSFFLSIFAFDYEVRDWLFMAIAIVSAGDLFLLKKYPKLGFIGFGLLVGTFYLLFVNTDVRLFLGLQDPIILID